MSPSEDPVETSWRELYTAALFESDRGKIASRIAAAETEIVRRGRMLFANPSGNTEERSALDHALHMLQALKSCIRTDTTRTLAA